MICLSITRCRIHTLIVVIFECWEPFLLVNVAERKQMPTVNSAGLFDISLFLHCFSGLPHTHMMRMLSLRCIQLLCMTTLDMIPDENNFDVLLRFMRYASLWRYNILVRVFCSTLLEQRIAFLIDGQHRVRFASEYNLRRMEVEHQHHTTSGGDWNLIKMLKYEMNRLSKLVGI